MHRLPARLVQDVYSALAAIEHAAALLGVVTRASNVHTVSVTRPGGVTEQVSVRDSRPPPWRDRGVARATAKRAPAPVSTPVAAAPPAVVISGRIDEACGPSFAARARAKAAARVFAAHSVRERRRSAEATASLIAEAGTRAVRSAAVSADARLQAFRDRSEATASLIAAGRS